MSNDTMMQNNEKIWKDDKRYFENMVLLFDSMSGDPAAVSQTS